MASFKIYAKIAFSQAGVTDLQTNKYLPPRLSGLCSRAIFNKPHGSAIGPGVRLKFLKGFGGWDERGSNKRGLK